MRRKIIDLFIYLLSQSLSRLSPFILLPVLTRELTQAEFGSWSMFQLLSVLSISIVGMNAQNTITRNFFNRPKEFIQEVCANTILVLLGSSLFWTLILVIATSLSFETFGIPTLFILMLPMTAFLLMLSEILLTVFRNEKKPLRFASLEISRAGIELIVSLVLVVVLALGLSGRIWGLVSTAVLFGVFSFFILHRIGYLRWRIRKSLLKEILEICLPLIPHAVAGIALSLGGRYFVGDILSIEDVSIYSAAYQFAMVLAVLGIALNRVWSPWLYEKLSQEKVERKVIESRMIQYCGGVLVTGIFIGYISKLLVPYILPPAYSEVESFVVIMCVGYAFYAMYNCVFPFFVYYKRTNTTAKITAFSAVVGLTSTVFLTNAYGLYGASFGFLFGYFVLFTLSYSIGLRIWSQGRRHSV
ncbi:lipopolysaccharide biosynthesis protein [Idiomarina abyssalis]|uniref:lipopolysaccharide biosynthesis protein n=1 Tax=Idiomarina abyssalis TaxID=86102 RepID=UPI003A8C8B63